jgi:hypothetical protein
MDFPITARKPEGGFVFLSVAQLCAVWCAYSHGLLHWLDVRVWCAAHELVARRCQCRPGTTPYYTHAELVPLMGGHRGLAAALQRLTTIGFVTWRSEAIGFGMPHVSATVQADIDAMLARMPRRRCDLPVPRRVLRFIAGGCRRSLWATLFGHLLTCLTYGQGQCRSGGYCTAAWIATTFGISLRSVKAARRHLLAIDVLQTVSTSCLVRNRHGAKMLVNLQWSGPTLTRASLRTLHTDEEEKRSTEAVANTRRTLPEPETSPESPPSTHVALPLLPLLSVRVQHETVPCGASSLMVAPQHQPVPGRNRQHHLTPSTPSDGHELAPPVLPDVHELAPPMTPHKLFGEEKKTQQLASGEPAGRLSALVRQAQEQIRAGLLPRGEEPRIEQRTATVRAHLRPPAAPAPVTQPPNVQHITRQDLREMERLLCVYEQAVDRGWIGSAEADRLTFVALAQHVLLYRAQNPGGLLHRLLTKRLFHYITQEDEDQALARLKAYEGAHGVRHVPDTTRSTPQA